MTFWREKSLTQMSPEEWESLCDGCGKCCLLKLEDEDTGRLAYTNIVCSLFDRKKGTCSDYPNRHERVPGCVKLTPENVGMLGWLPDTCAYRLVAHGQDLPDWHPLKTGLPRHPLQAEAFVGPYAVSEDDVDDDDMFDYVTAWTDDA